MTSSSALVPYRGTTTSTTLTTTSTSSFLIPARLFTAQTGHALATELLYRLLIDILNRLLGSLHRFASHQLDTFSSFLERKSIERQEAREAAKAAKELEEKRKEGLRISDEVGKAARERGFIGGGPFGGGFGAWGGGGPACPMTGEKGDRGPRGWVGDVLVGIQEGRMVERDFWVHPFQN